MTGDPRIEAAAPNELVPNARVTAALVSWTGDDWPTRGDWIDVAVYRRMEKALAAADAVERPIAQRLAEALYVSALRHHGYAHMDSPRVFEMCSSLHCAEARAALAEWDATQEPAT